MAYTDQDNYKALSAAQKIAVASAVDAIRAAFATASGSEKKHNMTTIFMIESKEQKES